ncbi:MAG: GTPase [Pseudomonadota bacterium]
MTYLTGIVVIASFVLPTLTVLPLGFLWLWERGLMLYWAFGACALTAILYAAQTWLLRPSRGQRSKPATPAAAVDGAAKPEANQDNDAPHADPPPADKDLDPTWAPRDIAAWRAVQALAAKVDADKLQSREDVIALGRRTIETVAKEVHPDRDNPLWHFTVPEALALAAQVSVQMRAFVVDTIPLGDRLTVGQALQIYRWRGTVGYAEKAYDVWRVIRLLNPLAAASQEIREKLTQKTFEWGRQQLAGRLARHYVEEVGRAAIDLYGGRLKVTAEEFRLSTAARAARSLASVPSEAPLRILLGGQVGAGKSSLVNALASEVKAAADVVPVKNGTSRVYAISHDALPAALVIDTPGVEAPAGDGGDDPFKAFITEADDCDLVIWVVSAGRADREIDRVALRAYRDYFAERPERICPPVFVVLNQVDRLRPSAEWSPPYDLTTVPPAQDVAANTPDGEQDAREAKTRAILAAMRTIASDLAVPLDTVVPACLDPDAGVFNVDAIWVELMEAMPDAKRAHLVRVLDDLDDGLSWRRLLRQTVNAGRALVGR